MIQYVETDSVIADFESRALRHRQFEFGNVRDESNTIADRERARIENGGCPPKTNSLTQARRATQVPARAHQGRGYVQECGK